MTGIRLAILLLVLACVPSSGGAAAAETRVALVVGNAAYKTIPTLDNAVTDAELIADTLRSLGFTLIGGGAQRDLGRASFEQAIQNFGRKMQGADVALFYYAGHGIQVGGSNYLVPVDAAPTREVDVDFHMIEARLVLRQMEGARTRLNLMILDACRNNPFGGRGLRAAAGGLAQMQAAEGTLISFATQPGNVAFDGDDGHSPYTRALAEVIRRPGLDLFQTFNEVGLAVVKATGGRQQPWVSSSPIAARFFFAGTTPAVAPETPSAVRPEPAIVRPAPDPCAAASDHWRSADRIGTRTALEDHLERFPSCVFAGLARARIAALATVPRTPSVPSTTPPPPVGQPLLQRLGPSSRWAVGGSPNCADRRSSYALEVRDGQLRWTSASGRVDIETVVASTEDEFRTTTVASPQQRIGQIWIYVQEAVGRIRVTPGGKSTFWLGRCP